ncbi:MAG: tetraacyldisaccharide 4'-kinase [Candidatus Dactylopiibacterium sp.]|nr:tetraacyldisaccharide 4'-kinase [Candidatus Dactylopiibacterium sp.]
MALRRPAWWDARGGLALAWLPVAALFGVLAALRRLAYRGGLLRSERLPVPVVVVGNLAAGGSGKTPVVIWLARALREAGHVPGILSRGYGGSARLPEAVRPDSDPDRCGDEPVLLARRTGCPLWIGRRRADAARALLAAHPEVNVLITDDGLQHYALARDAEIVVLNERILGNGWLMPAGPLREPLGRLRTATLLIANGDLGATLRARLPARPCASMTLRAGHLWRLAVPAERCDAAAFAGRRVHALAGIADPDRFFASLRALGLTLASTRAFGDHHRFTPQDLRVPEGDVLLLTEKDAVKCAALAPPDCWVLPVEAQLDAAALKPVLERLHGSEAA